MIDAAVVPSLFLEDCEMKNKFTKINAWAKRILLAFMTLFVMNGGEVKADTEITFDHLLELSDEFDRKFESLKSHKFRDQKIKDAHRVAKMTLALIAAELYQTNRSVFVIGPGAPANYSQDDESTEVQDPAAKSLEVKAAIEIAFERLQKTLEEFDIAPPQSTMPFSRFPKQFHKLQRNNLLSRMVDLRVFRRICVNSGEFV